MELELELDGGTGVATKARRQGDLFRKRRVQARRDARRLKAAPELVPTHALLCGRR